MKLLSDQKPKKEDNGKIKELNYKIDSLSESLKYQAMMNAMMQ